MSRNFNFPTLEEISANKTVALFRTTLQKEASSHYASARKSRKEQQNILAKAVSQYEAEQAAREEIDDKAWTKEDDLGTLWGLTKQNAATFTEAGFDIAGFLASVPISLEQQKILNTVPDAAKNAAYKKLVAETQATAIQEQRLKLMQEGQHGNLSIEEQRAQLAKLKKAESALPTLTAEEQELLQQKHTVTGMTDLGPMDLGEGTYEESMRGFYELTDFRNKIKDTIGGEAWLKGIAHPKSEQEYAEKMGTKYDEQAHHFKDTGKAWDEGDYGTALSEGAQGIAKFAAGVFETALTNPGQTSTFLAGIAPDLLAGGMSKKLLAAITSSEAIDSYSEALEEIQAREKRPPTAEESNKAALWSLSKIVPEYVMDSAILSKFKKPKSPPYSEVLKEDAKGGLRKLGEGSARTAGTASTYAGLEGATETYQTKAEQMAAGRANDGRELAIGGALGAVGGGSASGAGHALGEVRKTTDRHRRLQKSAETVERGKTNAGRIATETGDVSELLNVRASTYSPSMAGAVLINRANNPKLSEKERTEARQKMPEVLNTMTQEEKRIQKRQKKYSKENEAAIKEKLAAAQAILDNPDAELRDTVKARKEAKTYTRQLQNIRRYNKRNKVRDAIMLKQLAREHKRLSDLQLLESDITAPDAKEAQAIVDAVRTPETVEGAPEGGVSPETAPEGGTVEPQAKTPEVRKAEKEQFMALLMESPDSVDPDILDALADDEKADLSPSERRYVKSVAQAERIMATPDSVNKAILEGSPGHKGIKHYLRSIPAALRQKDEKSAAAELGELVDFVAAHTRKAELVREALKRSGKTGDAYYVVRPGDTDDTTSEWQLQKKRPFIHKPGRVLRIVNTNPKSRDLVSRIEEEAKLLQATEARLKEEAEILGATPGLFEQVAANKEARRARAAEQVQQAEALPEQLEQYARLQAEKELLTKKKKKNGLPPNGQNRLDAIEAELLTLEEVPNLVASYPDFVKQRNLEKNSNARPIDRKTQEIDQEIAAMTVPQLRKFIARQKRRLEEFGGSQTPTTQERNPLFATIRGDISNAERRLDELTGNKTTTAKSSPETKPEAKRKAAPAGALTVIRNAGERIKGQIPFDVFTKINLVAAYFTQSAAREGAKTKRPLVAVKDFASQWRLSPELIHKFLDLDEGEELSERQSALLSKLGDFIESNDALLAKIMAVPLEKNKPDQRHWDYSNYLRNDATEDGKPKALEEGQETFDENLRTAILVSAFTWVAENAGSYSGLNTKRGMLGILGRGDDDDVSRDEWAELGRVGDREKMVTRTLGKRAAQMLGMSVTRSAPKNHQSNLEQALGAHALALLLQLQLVKRTRSNHPSLTRGDETYNPDVRHGFIAVNRNWDDPEFSLVPAVADIYEASKETESIVPKLFGTDSGKVDPVFKKPTFSQKYAKGTKRVLGKVLTQLMSKVARRPYTLAAVPRQLREAMDQKYIEKAAGVRTDPYVYIEDEKSTQAKNAATQREIDQLNEFEATMLQRFKSAFTQFFIIPNVWKVQRVGTVPNTVDPLAYKYQRANITKPSWQTVIDTSQEGADNKQGQRIHRFKMAVAQSLGIKTEQMTSELWQDALDKKLALPEIAAALEVLEALPKIGEGKKLSPEQQEILAAVGEIGSENWHSVVGLAHYANYLKAKPTGDTFETDITYEVDGVANGPAIIQALLGVLKHDDGAKFGFFSKSDKATSFPVWRSVPGHHDQYEVVATTVIADIYSKYSAEELEPLMFFLGDFTDDTGAVTKAGRNAMKSLLRPIVFGSAGDKSISDMADAFVSDALSSLAKYANEGDDAKLLTTINHVNRFINPNAKPVTELPSREALMEITLDKRQKGAIKQYFLDMLEDPLNDAVNVHFGEFTKVRKQLNTAAQLAWEIYDTTYKHLREAKLRETENLPRGKDGKAWVDLTEEQEAETQEQLQQMLPVMQTPFSIAANNPDAGIFMGKAATPKIVTGERERAYSGTTKFGVPITNNNPEDTKATLASLNTRGVVMEEESPGVAMALNGTHASDSFIAGMTYAIYDALHVHDAEFFALDDVTDGAKRLNEMTYSVLYKYDLPTAINNALQVTLSGFNTVLTTLPVEDAKVLRGKVDAIATRLGNRYKKDKEMSALFTGEGLADLQRYADRLKYNAITQEITKLSFLHSRTHINQYALEGGEYTVTDADRKAVKAKIQKLKEQRAALRGTKDVKPVETKVSKPRNPRNTQDTPWGKLGESPYGSDPRITAFFEARAKDKTPAKEVITFLRTLDDLSPQYREWLRALELAVPDNTTVHYITPDRPTKHNETRVYNARGITFVNKDSAQIWLKSPDFAKSGLTPELLMHELFHAATRRQVATAEALIATGKKRGTAKEAEIFNAYKRLEEIYELAKPKLGKYGKAITSVDELISWGLTNPEVQEILANITHTAVLKGPKDGKKRNLFEAFLNTLIELVLPQSVKGRTSSLLAHLIVETGNLLSAADGIPEPITVAEAPLAPKPPKKRRKPGKSRREVNWQKDSLAKAVAKLGGIHKSYMADIGADKNIHLGGGLWVFSDKGHGLDDMASKLGEYGYLTTPEMESDLDNGGVNRLTELLSGELFQDQPVYAPGSPVQEQQLEDMMLAHEDAMQQMAEEQDQDADDSPETPDGLTMEDVDPSTFDAQDTFDALGKVDRAQNGHVKNVAFRKHLTQILDEATTAAYGPFGVFEAAAKRHSPLSTDDVFLQALADGEAPFASKAKAHLAMPHQALFVLEAVEATMQAGMREAPISRGEVRKLFNEARVRLKGRLSKDDYDFIFNRKADDPVPDFLSRFLALSLAYEPLHTELQKLQLQVPGQTAKPQTIAERVKRIYHKIANWIGRVITRTSANQTPGERLHTLTRRIAQIERRNQQRLLRRQETAENIVVRLADSARAKTFEKIEKLGRSPALRKSKSQILRGLGGGLSILGGDRGALLLDHLKEMRDTAASGKYGTLMETFNEMRGANEDTQAFYTLLRTSNLLQQTRKHIKSGTSELLSSSFLTPLKENEVRSQQLLHGIIRTDIAALAELSMQEIEQLYSDPAVRAKLIKELENKLSGPFKLLRLRGAKDLAYHMVSGDIKNQVAMFNAHNIAFLGGTEWRDRVTEAEGDAIAAILDQLISLYAVEYLSPDVRNAVSEVFREENNRKDGNGMELLIQFHRAMQKEAKESNFDGSAFSMHKGYFKEITNPDVDIKIADETEGEALEQAGYVRGDSVTVDADDSTTTPNRHIYVLKEGGASPLISGIMSTKGERASGSLLHSGVTRANSDWKHLGNERVNRQILAKRRKILRQYLKTPLNYDPRKVTGPNYMAPVLGPSGEVVNWRYMMADKTKALLQPDYRVEHVLGGMAAATFDKVESKKLNRSAISAMKQQYDEDAANFKLDGYILFGPKSDDPEIREAYHLLPEDTKAAIKETWKGKSMMVRNDIYNMTFGYRKASLASGFHTPEDERTVVRGFLLGAAEYFWGEAAAAKVRKYENIWQGLVKEVKDIWIIKNLFTLVGNVLSNVTVLLWTGVSPWAIVRDHVAGLISVLTYQRDRKKLFRLQQLAKIGKYEGSQNEHEQQMLELEDSMRNSPVKELIDAGMFQTIVEDIELDEDIYSYKSQLSRWAGEKTAWIPKSVKTATKTALLAQGTVGYNVLAKSTQLSDFLSRYALHKHLTTRKNQPLSKEESLQWISDVFVNYDIPTHRNVQYLNDMGLLYFTKYYLRIQKVIMKLWREQPARALGILLLQNFLPGMGNIMDSAFWGRLGDNPLYAGALHLPGAMLDIISVKAAMNIW